MRKRKNAAVILSVAALIVLLLPVAADAATGESWYKNNVDVLYNNDFISSAFRTIGWGATGGICKLADICGTLYDYTFAFIDITKFGKVSELLTKFRPVLAALVVLSLSALGIVTMMDRSKKVNVARNIILGMVIVCCSISGFTILNNMAYGFKEGVLGTEKMKQSYELVESNIVDLIRIDKKGNIDNLNYYKGKGIIYGAGIKDRQSFKEIKFNEVLNFSDTANGKNLYNWSDSFDTKIRSGLFKVNEKYVVRDLDTGILGTGIGNEYYYRYSFDWLTCWMQLVAYMIVILALSYKNTRIAFELTESRILGYLHAADISSGERLKNILLYIRDLYITLAVSILSIKLYFLLSAYLTSTGASGILKGVMSLFIAYCVIDGPNIAQRITGIDAGLQSSVARAMGVISVGKGAAKGAGRAAGRAAGMMIKAGEKSAEKAIKKAESYANKEKHQQEEAKNGTQNGSGGSSAGAAAAEAMNEHEKQSYAEGGNSGLPGEAETNSINQSPSVSSDRSSGESPASRMSAESPASRISAESPADPIKANTFMPGSEPEKREEKSTMTVDFMESDKSPVQRVPAFKEKRREMKSRVMQNKMPEMNKTERKPKLTEINAEEKDDE